MNIELGYACNNNCIHCSIGYERRKRAPDRTASEVKNQIWKAHNDGSPCITLLGGEPTVRKDFFDILKFSKRMGLAVGIESNGRLFSSLEFTEKTLSILPNAHFSISLHHSVPEIQDRIVRVAGAHRQTVQGIKNLSKAGAKKITVIPVVTRLNYASLPSIVKLCKDCGATEIIFTFVRGMGNALENYRAIAPRVVLVVPKLIAAIKKGVDLGIPVRTYAFPYCLLKGWEKHAYELRFLEFYLKGKGIRFREIGSNIDWQRERLRAKAKAIKCKRCRYFCVCEGVWKEYLHFYGADEVAPVHGKRITSLRELYKDICASE